MQCNFEKLCAYVNNELNENSVYEVLAHLHQCDICMEAVIQMSAEQAARSLVLASSKRPVRSVETVCRGVAAKESGWRRHGRHASQKNIRTVSKYGMGSANREV
jgi:anti-sigma factor RsiW